MALLDQLSLRLPGIVHTDELTRKLYATDASVYRRLPQAVALPQTIEHIQELIRFAERHNIGIIPRTAGTSLAGQCVGEGIVVDVSRHFTKILDFDASAKTVTVQPGVIRDDLNRFLKPHGLFFGPNTATANRCMIGGMVGNNSSGSTSIRYGVTRDKIVQLKAVLSDGELATFEAISAAQLSLKQALPGVEGQVYRLIGAEYGKPEVQQHIREEFPDARIKRRNTGYALDELLTRGAPQQIDLCALLAGSEGTLAFTTEVTLKLDELPPTEQCLVVAHYKSIQDCLEGVVPLMEHELYMCEMIDRTILDLTRSNPQQSKNRALIHGEPEAILLLELRADSATELAEKSDNLRATIVASGLSYAQPEFRGEDVARIIDLRKAGLGILGNMVGDEKAVACIEDTAVTLPDLAAYIKEFTAIMERHERKPVYYAHAGAGELHLRPILNLKDPKDVELFKTITDEVAALVKRYNGSMSGEHGDGIVRAGYIPLIVGERNFELMRKVKLAFDPHGVFNPGKIIDPYPMTEQLRYEVGREEPKVDTLMDFSDAEGILRLAEKCNGTGACRRSAEAGGTMCPSYKVTKNEVDSTRGRANVLREVLTHSDKANKFDSEELKQAYDLCLSCKGCAHECPSTVDVGTMKAEFLYQYQKANGFSWRSKAFAYNDKLNRLGRLVRPLTNFTFKNSFTSGLLKRTLGVASKRSLPLLSERSLKSWASANLGALQPLSPKREVYFFVDEFTNQLDADIGIDALKLLTKLGYAVKLVEHEVSGRAYISKGFLEEAREVAEQNVAIFSPLISADVPLVGLEPSAILTFRDEYPRLVRGDEQKAKAHQLGAHALLIDEFLHQEIEAGRIDSSSFSESEVHIKLHGHCHQKALSDMMSTVAYLSLPTNYHIDLIPSGCCGMAGSFGYEEEHYGLSMAVGEQVLFPAVRSASAKTVIAAVGTSCRHQILDGTGREVKHPVSVLLGAVRE